MNRMCVIVAAAAGLAAGGVGARTIDEPLAAREAASAQPATGQPASGQPATGQPAAGTTASGYAWKKLVTEPYRGKQDDVFFVDPRTGWYVNGLGRIYRTNDGGETWVRQLEKTGTYFRCVGFLDAQRGFAGNIGTEYFPGVTDTTPLYATRDGGATWEAVKIDGDPVTGLCALEVVREPFINAGVLDHKVRIVGVGRVGGPAVFVWSDDQGATWTARDMAAEAGMAMDVHFLDRQHGVMAAGTSPQVDQSRALILRTEDGGKTWTEVYRGSRTYELTWKISFPTREVGYVTVQSYNPDPKASERFVAKTVDGGRTWTEMLLVNDAKVRQFGVGFIDEKTGWVGAVPGGFATTDGGATWTPADMGNAVNKIRVLKTDEGWTGFAIGVEVRRLEKAGG
jgi:photosystem II stability/assembly factor-like uncharacterized protein